MRVIVVVPLLKLLAHLQPNDSKNRKWFLLGFCLTLWIIKNSVVCILLVIIMMIWAKNGKKNFQYHVGLWIQIKMILKTASTMHDFLRGSVLLQQLCTAVLLLLLFFCLLLLVVVSIEVCSYSYKFVLCVSNGWPSLKT